MKKILSTVIILIFFMSVSAFAQNYDKTIGLRFGNVPGLTFKKFVKQGNAIEAILSWGRYGFNLTGLYEYQKPIKDVERLDWYLGIGGHFAYWYADDYYGNVNHAIFGADFIMGLEYTLKDAPFSFSIDYKPGFNFVGPVYYWTEGAISVRYIF